jgi:hypothetical protein
MEKSAVVIAVEIVPDMYRLHCPTVTSVHSGDPIHEYSTTLERYEIA